MGLTNFKKHFFEYNNAHEHYYFTIERTPYDEDDPNDRQLTQEDIGIGLFKKNLDEEIRFYQIIRETNPSLFEKLKPLWNSDFNYEERAGALKPNLNLRESESESEEVQLEVPANIESEISDLELDFNSLKNKKMSELNALMKK